MKKLGRVSKITRDGLILVESILKDPRRLVGQQVYDPDLKVLGRIVDVIGRVESPYVVIKPLSSDIISLVEVGSTIYYRTARKKPRRKPGRGRRRGRRSIRRRK